MTKQSTLKKEKLKDEHFEVARARNCAECGSDEEMRGLALHPSASLYNTYLEVIFLAFPAQIYTN